MVGVHPLLLLEEGFVRISPSNVLQPWNVVGWKLLVLEIEDYLVHLTHAQHLIAFDFHRHMEGPSCQPVKPAHGIVREVVGSEGDHVGALVHAGKEEGGADAGHCVEARAAVLC
ncbi:hypothetical protein CRG98_029873 [Punica granatum]|uniref:Uncharacterized protein n=1 Tax=Punica granatum TaxID=22663 RepID=A0A2I0J0G9_PUNGR|nr:hypothetical protein CRG98_029873 [Punica granatum]